MEDNCPAKKVFDNYLLRDLILSFVIYSTIETGGTSSKDIKTCRIFNKSWNGSVTRLLRKSNHPMFHLNLDKSNSLTGKPYVLENGKLLANFTEFAEEQLHLGNYLPTFTLNLTCFTVTDFNENVSKDFTKCLSLCGEGLIELCLTLPKDAHFMKLDLTNTYFPRLCRFIVNFEDKSSRWKTLNYSIEVTDRLGKFISSVLSGCSVLEFFSFRGAWNHHKLSKFEELTVPEVFDFRVLPPSLTILDINCTMLDTHLEGIAGATIPNMKNLHLLVRSTPFEDELVFKVLHSVANSLEFLQLEPTPYVTFTRLSTFLTLPVLKKLEILSINSPHVELKNGIHSLEKCIPATTHLGLSYHSVPRFLKWTKRSTYRNIKYLNVSLIDMDFAYWERTFNKDVDLEVISAIHTAFPNLEHLKLTVAGADITGITHVFQYLTQLKGLTIIVLVGNEDFKDTYRWDSLFLGTSIEETRSLREYPNSQDRAEVWMSKFDSIVNLQELEILELLIHPKCCPCGFQNGSLISDAVFQFGFSQMPNLRNINLQNHFQV